MRFAGAVMLGWGLAVAAGGAQPWSLTNAPVRFRVERVGDSPWPAPVGNVEVWPLGLEAAYASVFTADGKQVQSQAYWTGGAGPSKFRFSTASGAAMYYLYLHREPAPPLPAWKAEAGVLVETRNCRNLPANTAEDLRRVLVSSSVTYGRGYVPNVFLGHNPYGPSVYYVALFNGYFDVNQSGEYSFATTSSDASYLRVDDHPVAQWFGRHNAWGGVHGEHAGKLVLQPGRHHLEYVQVQFDGASAAVAAWKPPGAEYVQLMAPGAFVPVARFQVTACEPAPQTAPTPYVEWQTLEHCLAGDVALVRSRFHLLDSRAGRAYRWEFDDGGSGAGRSLEHLFARGGRRQVKLHVLEGGATVATRAFVAELQPHWPQREDWRPGLYEQAGRYFLEHDLAPAPNADLIALVELADRADDLPLLRRAGALLVQRQGEAATGAPAALFYRLAVLVEHAGDAGGALAEKALRTALLAGTGASALTERVKLRLADLLLNGYGRVGEARPLLDALANAAGLTDAERRRRRLLLGDALFEQGNLEEARKTFLSVSAKAERAAARFDLRPAARLESARLLLSRGELEAAEEALEELDAESPAGRLGLDRGLIRVSLYLKRKEFQRAWTWSQRLLRTPADDRLSAELLLLGAEAADALGKAKETQTALERLVHDYPYSEAAARAKDKWGTRPVRARKS